MTNIYLLIESEQEGPHTEEQVREYLAEGRIRSDQLAWKEGMSEWMAVSRILSEDNISPPPHLESTNLADIYFVINGAKQGPYTEKQLKQFLVEGSLTSDILIWREGQTERVPVSAILTERTAAPLSVSEATTQAYAVQAEAQVMEKAHCVSCGQPSSTSGRSILCVSEAAELSNSKDGSTTTEWRITDKKEWNIFICTKCLASKYEGRLNNDLLESRKNLKNCVLCLVGSIVFFPIANTGIFKYLGILKLVIALIWCVCIFQGLYGIPKWLYVLSSKTAARAKFLASGTIPESQLAELYFIEGERIRASLEGENMEFKKAPSLCYSLPSFQDTNSIKRRRIIAST